ncbi:hypothetical protein NY607_12310 [Lysinibacillus sp. A4]|uniref:hypothetical protein n=1 Tax=Lysinibacillus sp. A4 TaxID=2976269 RepID=UPI002175BFA4|nr:hypothetical protein [Lysinibacillus sp. A4]MCS5501909.1 hypothetical protein [Lysinibacillus sp. A4]
MEDIVSVEFNAWWLLVVPSMLIIAIVSLTLIVKIPPLIKKDIKKKSLTSWIEVKDLLYWLLIICLGSISLFTYQYRGNSEVIDHWGFAGTIVSIILAVVAIGFTLFQTLSSNLSSEKIADSAIKIEQVTQNLDSKALSESSQVMIESAEFLRTKINLIEDKLNSINIVQETLNEIAASSFGKGPSTDSDSLNLDAIDLDVFIDKVIPHVPYYSKMYLYMHVRLYNSKIYFNEKTIDGIRDEISKYDRNNQIQTSSEEYLKGANLASEAATRCFFIGLGLRDKFKELSNDKQISIIDKIKKLIHDHHSNLVDDYINNLK